MKFEQTLGNQQWLRINENKLRELFPATWTHMKNTSPLKVGFSLKLMGIDWRSNTEYAEIMIYLYKMGILQQDEQIIRRNPDSIFNTPQSE